MDYGMYAWYECPACRFKVILRDRPKTVTCACLPDGTLMKICEIPLRVVMSDDAH